MLVLFTTLIFALVLGCSLLFLPELILETGLDANLTNSLLALVVLPAWIVSFLVVAASFSLTCAQGAKPATFRTAAHFLVQLLLLAFVYFIAKTLFAVLVMAPVSYFQHNFAYDLSVDIAVQISRFSLPVTQFLSFLLLSPILMRLAFVLPSAFTDNPLGLRAAFRQSRGQGWPMARALFVPGVPISLLFTVIPANFRIASWLDADYARTVAFTGLTSFVWFVMILLFVSVLVTAYNRSIARSFEEVWD